VEDCLHQSNSPKVWALQSHLTPDRKTFGGTVNARSQGLTAPNGLSGTNCQELCCHCKKIKNEGNDGASGSGFFRIGAPLSKCIPRFHPPVSLPPSRAALFVANMQRQQGEVSEEGEEKGDLCTVAPLPLLANFAPFLSLVQKQD
jgi:hypothetical protein